MAWYKCGGGKPEEEKTVTAGTSAIVVNPSSGKVMKKVTVNPTPTESKSVTPTTSKLTVTPSEGKHLSQVVVGAVEDVTPEVTAQTPVITQIAENLGVTITTPSGTNKQILQGNNANLLNINNNAKKEGLYVWKKLTSEGGTFVDYVVDNNESKYPDGGTQDGYWYEKVVEGVAGIDFGEVTLASTAESVTFEHSLGVVPSFAAFISNNFDVSTSKSETFMNVNGHVLYTHNMVAGNVNCKTADVGLTETTISFGTYSSNLPFAATTYYWIAIA